MNTQRKIILLVTVVLAGGSLAATSVYALRLHSDAYRREIERYLSLFFDLPCEVARIRGRTFSSRAFEDVQIYLPDRRDRVFSCKTAIWHEEEADGQEQNRLELENGLLVLGSDRWLYSDYRQILRSGLEHDFEALDLAEVDLSDFEIAFDRGELSIRCRQTSGKIDMREAGRGVARLHAYELNGHAVHDGVGIHARFSPRNGVEIEQLTLALPRVPLTSIGVGPALGGDVTRGQFAGRIRYADQGASERPEVFLDGELLDGDLAELTRRVPFGPFEGKFSVDVDQIRIAEGLVTHFHGRGTIDEFVLAGFAPLLGVPRLSGSASLRVDEAAIALGRIDRLRLEGQLRDVVLQEVLRKWGKGAATGVLSVRVNNFDLAGERIESADVEITALPPKRRPGVIDRAMLLSVAEKALGFTWPEALPQGILPEEVEYTRFGVRLQVQDNTMRILGTHGEDGDTILTVRTPAALQRFFGKTIGLVKEPSGTIDLTPHLAAFFERLRDYDPQRVRDWWESKQQGP